ncbi:hypothetical protein MNQ96_00890 [Sphingopyxis granuli]|uniref:hypothetical protein n=1 Tax=Sphingopyxis TaxID=165697 RepID=UPI000CDF348A|nr:MULTISPECIES: hypothetical protein [Sphingopyxis]AVA15162.1 hypothetical protein C3E99_16050 [Sphingopyxis sp. MG]UNK79688.1 hypothetical protein MNQ96_00890 [Sphingopyxis granuli]
MTPFRRLPLFPVLAGAALLALAACGSGDDAAPPSPADAQGADAQAAADRPAAPSEAAALPAPTDAAPAAKAGDAKGLAAYVGNYPFDKVDGVAWNDHPAVKAGLAATVKDAKVLKAIQTLEGPAAPIEMHDGKVMAWACQQHNCGPHQWAVLVDPATGATDVCYYDEAASASDARWFLAGGKEERRKGNCQFGAG